MTMLQLILKELRIHAPFTSLGTATGVLLMVVFIQTGMSRETSAILFWACHPIHVFLSALVTAGMYRLHGNIGFWKTLAIGYFGSIGIATLSDSIIPFIGEILLDMPNRGLHLGVLEKWWMVNPLAFLGITVAFIRPQTKFPHAGHVFLSTWASLFHMTMAMESGFSMISILIAAVFLFIAVWAPCCTSDIVFPLLFSKTSDKEQNEDVNTRVQDRMGPTSRFGIFFRVFIIAAPAFIIAGSTSGFF